MRLFKVYLRFWARRPWVRPWALSAPLVVLLICLPLLRPLRHPDPRMISDDEQARLATIQAVVEQHTLQIQRTAFFATREVIRIIGRDGQPHWYSDQSPVMSVLLSGPYWVLHHWGLGFDRNPLLVEYLLTLLGVTLPVALAAGLLYHMARMFELKRPIRAALALAVVIGSGWISYATVLNAGSAAAALVVLSAACLVQASITLGPTAALAWVGLGGFCAALAGTYELTALAFLVFFIGVVLAMRWPMSKRLMAVGLYAGGALVPLLLYAGLNRPITGDLRPGFMHLELSPTADVVEGDGWLGDSRRSDDDDDSPAVSHSFSSGLEQFLAAFIGGHGLLTHFPVLILGGVGMSMVMHRHWPLTTKLLASATIAGALGIVIGYTWHSVDWRDAMFANRWFLVFLPLTLFWAGAWLRRPHAPAAWAAVGLLWGISAFIALLGATDPEPRQGYDRYSAAGAFMHLVQPPRPPADPDIVAER